jgi:hypothetical protein
VWWGAIQDGSGADFVSDAHDRDFFQGSSKHDKNMDEQCVKEMRVLLRRRCGWIPEQADHDVCDRRQLQRAAVLMEGRRKLRQFALSTAPQA